MASAQTLCFIDRKFVVFLRCPVTLKKIDPLSVIEKFLSLPRDFTEFFCGPAIKTKGHRSGKRSRNEFLVLGHSRCFPCAVASVRDCKGKKRDEDFNEDEENHTHKDGGATSAYTWIGGEGGIRTLEAFKCLPR